MFFLSWELWQKMTFVSISCVFLLGWIKLLWKVRSEKRHEIVDEEKRSKIRELKISGRSLESRGKPEIPFGVRAIQSGIQVDGIWISNPNTPVPSELNLVSIPNESSDESGSSDQRLSPSTLAPPRLRPKLRVRSLGRPDSYGGRRFPETLQDITEGSVARTTYKPRNSSHLRYADSHESEPETIEQNDEKLSSKKKMQSPRIRVPPRVYIDADSSAADSERNSGTSDESDASLSQDPTTIDERRSLTASGMLSTPSPTLQPSRGSLQRISTTPALPQNPSAETITSIGEPFAAECTRLLHSEPSQFQKHDDLQFHLTLPFCDRVPSLSTPTDLHMNSNTRQVNPGFEVLPAGTFGKPAELSMPNEAAEQSNEHRECDQKPTEKKTPAKLQKKPRSPTLEQTGLAGGP
ncbi:Bgt-3683 [Blumeria graminis f. sp. tritici]|uniref:Bgt-3683 n=2 Tax=Blumeria graminis f. sp. tritici TaxID=62690 RepID=A0A061HIJ0_BLUGR|nr:hypothetical protein BGT96224_3683 [Blumeria graminis f. sp. tritici 96224]VDB92670.1 Bgt-3683 [Blumeria graminis f. sp. tritici]